MATKKKLCFEIVLEGMEGLQVKEYTAEKVVIRVKEGVWARLDHRTEEATGHGGANQEDDLMEVKDEILAGPLEDMAVTVKVETSESFTEEVESVESEEEIPTPARLTRARRMLQLVAAKRSKSLSEVRVADLGQAQEPPSPSQSGSTGRTPSGATAMAARTDIGGAKPKIRAPSPKRSQEAGTHGNRDLGKFRAARPFARGPISQWQPSLPTFPGQFMEHCTLISCGIRMLNADRRGHALKHHLPSFFGNEYEESRLTATQKIRLRREYVLIILNAKGLDTPAKRSLKALRGLLAPGFTTTVMAPLDQGTMKEYCLNEGQPIPRRWTISEMGLDGFNCWQGGMALLKDLNSQEMEVLGPELALVGKRLLTQQGGM